MEIDRKSLLVRLGGNETLGEAEKTLRAEGLTLGLSSDSGDAAIWTDCTVSQWIDRGGPCARDLFQDPASQTVAGFDATLADGRALSVRPSPRRAVGPDLLPLFWGQDGRFGSVQAAWLLAQRLDARVPTTAPCSEHLF